jgi:hypothetical protein
MEKKIKIIETTDENGKRLKLFLRPLGHKVLQEAQMIYNVELTSLIKKSVSEDAKLFSRQQLEHHLNDIGIWTEDDNKLFLRLQLELRSMELSLKSGGIKVCEAKKIALEMKIKRTILMALYGRRIQFDGITMESIADNKKFKFLLTKCVVTVDGDVPFFANIDDYESRQNEQSAVDAASALATQLYGYDDKTEANLIENKWLKQFGFADDRGRLIDSGGKLTDMDGHLIDKNGRLIDEQGDFVDNQGRRVDKNGDFVVVTKPFLDDNTGKPLGSKPIKCKSRSKKQK